VPGFITEDLVALFESGRITALDANGVPHEFNYRLFDPVKHRGPGKYPLVVWLHGHGALELVHKNVGQLKFVEMLVIQDTSHPEKYPFYFLAPQTPQDNDQWFRRGSDATGSGQAPKPEPGEVVISLIDQLIAERSIDVDRIYLCGISMGGTNSWEMAMRYPDRFAAIVPLACAGTNRPNLERIANIPIWAFHSTIDSRISASAVRSTIQRLSDLGGHCTLTITPDVNHDCWHTALLDYGALDWLLAQHRGKEYVAPTGRVVPHRSFPWSVLWVCALGLLFIGAWRQETRLRRGKVDRVP
jgi:predicted peptidase